MADIYNEEDNRVVNGTNNADEIENYGYNVTVNALGGNDYIRNEYSRYSTLNGGKGNDTIWNLSSNTTVDGGADNDFIYNFYADNYSGGDNVSINGGAGKDTIWNNYGENVTINGGAGNDVVSLTATGSVLYYKVGDGNDTVYNFNGTDTLSISGGAYSTQISGNDVIVKAGTGSILLKNAKGKSFIINGNVEGDTSVDLNFIALSDGDDVICNLNASITMDGGAGNDSIKNWVDNVTINGGAGNDTILNNTGSNVTMDGGDGNDYIANNWSDEHNISINGGTGNDTILNYWCYNVTIDAGNGNDSIENRGENVTINGGDGDDYIHNDGSNSSINGSDGNDYIYNTYGSDSVTIDAGAGDDYIDNYEGENVLFTYAAGDGNDTVVGFNETSTLSIGGATYSSETSGSDVIVTVGNGKITLQGAATLDTLNIDGEEQTANILTLTDTDGATTLAADIVSADATARTKAIKITGNELDNTILGGGGKDILYGKDGDDFIDGGKNSDKLYGQNGNDTLHGGAGNDSLWGGSGNDLFVYSAGNDIITDYAAGDKISLGANVSSTTVDGSNVIFTAGTNTLTVKDGKGKELTLIDADGNEYTTLIGGLVLDNTAGATTLAAGVTEADASSRTKAIKITGNELDNTIFGGGGKDFLYGADGGDYLAGGANADKLYGQNGNDTLWGGMGNDTLDGGAGADVFLYDTGEGKDVISGFANDDMLLITGAFSASVNSSAKTIAFKVDSTADAITLKNYTATSFNINGFKYHISGTKLVK